MKKRLLATLLSLLLILSLTPITAFAQAQEVTDTNGVTLNYEVTSSPQNGEYYVEGEEVDIIISVTNNSSETISEYSLDNGYTAIYNNLLPGNSSEKLSCSYVVSAEDAEAGTKSFDIGCTYKLNGQTDNNTLSKTLTVSTGRGTEIPESNDPITLEAGFAALTETTSLPYNAEVDLGGAGTVRYDLGDGDFTYGKLLKVEVADGQVLNMAFRGSDERIDTVIEIYREESPGRFSEVASFDNDNSNDTGESAKYILPEAGTYYLAFLGYYEDETGLCSLNISAVAAPEDMTIEEGFAALETTQLPYSAEVDLGGEGSVHCDLGGGDFTYGKLLKVEVADGQMLNMDFYGSGERIDTVIEIYREESSDQFSEVASFDNDNSNDTGESAKYILPEAGTYYLAFLGYDEDEMGLCSLNISAVAAPEVVTIEEGFAALTETTTLPYSAEVDLGGEGAVLYIVEDYTLFAELLKVDLKQGDFLRMGFYSADSSDCDTYLEIYQEDGSGGFTRLTDFDANNMRGDGESALYTVPEDGVYYLAFEGYDEMETGLCRLEVEVIPAGSIATGTLDFTADPAPVPGADDLWSWDEASKTLTLKDGFLLYNDDPDLDDLILLPDGATVVVEGSAKIYDAGNGSIVSEGVLTVRGEGAETASLEILGSDYAIYTDHDVLITGIDFSCSDCNMAISGQGVRIENSAISAGLIDILMDAYGDVDIIDSDVSLSEAEIGITTTGTVTLDGGSFTGTFYTGGIGAERIVLTGDLRLNLRGLSSYSELLYTGSMEVSLEETVRIYDADGTVLYEGLWDDALFDAGEGMIMVNGVPAAGMEVHRHVYDQQVTSDRYLASAATCTEAATYYYSCVCGEKGTETFAYGAALGHGETELKDAREASCTAEGYTGDRVCKVCGEIVEKGEAIPKTAHAFQDGVCTVCGTVESNDNTQSPQTGDNSNIALWIGLMLVSCTVLAATVIYRRKRHCGTR